MQKKATGKPGIMLYFDKIIPALSRLEDAQIGALLRAIIEYAQTGALPELDGMTGLVFDMLRPGLDRDEERYQQSVVHGSYMAYCKKCKENGSRPISEDEYRESYQLLSVTDSNCQLPTTTPAPTPSASASVTQYPSTTGTPAGAGKGEPGGSKGDERENPASPDCSRLDAWKSFEQRRAAEVAKAQKKTGKR